MATLLDGWNCGNCKIFNGSVKEWLSVCRSCGQPGPSKPITKVPAPMTYEDVVQGCKNIGYDLNCGQCASVFFTGSGNYPHSTDCKTERRSYTVWPLENTTKLRAQVSEFHRMIDAPINTIPMVPTEDRIRLKLNLIMEEVLELLYAVYCRGDLRDAFELREGRREFASIKQKVEVFLRYTKIDLDIADVANALANLDYVVESARLEFGINGLPIADEVHRATWAVYGLNMAKAGGFKRADGKYMKPEWWTPPDVAGELVKQGWKKP